MDRTQQLRSLVAAIDSGSLSAAARRLGVTQSAVSQKLAALEAALGQPLLVRSRAGVKPTPAGRLAYDHGLRILAELAEMDTALDALRGRVTGRLRVTAATLLAETVLGPVITGLRRQHRELKVDVLATDAVVDMADQRIDVALRFGAPGQDEAIVRKIGEMEGLLIASPSYLATVAPPRRPEDLASLSYVQYRDDPEETTLTLMHAGGRIMAPVNPSFSAPHPGLLTHAVVSGLGFTKAARFFVADHLKSGRLVQLLPGYAPVPKSLYLLLSEHARNTLRARVFCDALMPVLAGIEGFSVASDLRAMPASTTDRA